MILHPDGGAMMEDHWFCDPGVPIDEDFLANDLAEQISDTDVLALVVFARDGEGYYALSHTVLHYDYQKVWAAYLEGLLVYCDADMIELELAEWELFYGYSFFDRGESDELAG